MLPLEAKPGSGLTFKLNYKRSVHKSRSLCIEAVRKYGCHGECFDESFILEDCCQIQVLVQTVYIYVAWRSRNIVRYSGYCVLLFTSKCSKLCGF